MAALKQTEEALTTATAEKIDALKKIEELEKEE